MLRYEVRHNGAQTTYEENDETLEDYLEYYLDEYFDESTFGDLLNDAYGVFNVGNVQFSASEIIKNVDSNLYHSIRDEEIDSIISRGMRELEQYGRAYIIDLEIQDISGDY